MPHLSTSCTAGFTNARVQDHSLPPLHDQLDLEKAIRFIVETVLFPRLDNLSQSIRDLAANDHRFVDKTAVYRLPVLLKRLGISKSTWYAWKNEKSASYDPTLPQAIKLGEHPRSPVVWRQHEIEAWIEARAIASRVCVNGGAA